MSLSHGETTPLNPQTHIHISCFAIRFVCFLRYVHLLRWAFFPEVNYLSFFVMFRSIFRSRITFLRHTKSLFYVRPVMSAILAPGKTITPVIHAIP